MSEAVPMDSVKEKSRNLETYKSLRRDVEIWVGNYLFFFLNFL